MAPTYELVDLEALMAAIHLEVPIIIDDFMLEPVQPGESALSEGYAATEIDDDEDEGSLSTSRYRTMEAASLRLQKEAKGYLDSLRGMLL
jgi:hypothetical protein